MILVNWQGFGKTQDGPWARCEGGPLNGEIHEVKGIALIVPILNPRRVGDHWVFNFRTDIVDYEYMVYRGNRPGELIYRGREGRSNG